MLSSRFFINGQAVQRQLQPRGGHAAVNRYRATLGQHLVTTGTSLIPPPHQQYHVNAGIAQPNGINVPYVQRTLWQPQQSVVHPSNHSVGPSTQWSQQQQQQLEEQLRRQRDRQLQLQQLEQQRRWQREQQQQQQQQRQREADLATAGATFASTDMVAHNDPTPKPSSIDEAARPSPPRARSRVIESLSPRPQEQAADLPRVNPERAVVEKEVIDLTNDEPEAEQAVRAVDVPTQPVDKEHVVIEIEDNVENMASMEQKETYSFSHQQFQSKKTSGRYETWMAAGREELAAREAERQLAEQQQQTAADEQAKMLLAETKKAAKKKKVVQNEEQTGRRKSLTPKQELLAEKKRLAAEKRERRLAEQEEEKRNKALLAEETKKRKREDRDEAREEAANKKSSRVKKRARKGPVAAKEAAPVSEENNPGDDVEDGGLSDALWAAMADEAEEAGDEHESHSDALETALAREDNEAEEEDNGFNDAFYAAFVAEEEEAGEAEKAEKEDDGLGDAMEPVSGNEDTEVEKEDDLFDDAFEAAVEEEACDIVYSLEANPGGTTTETEEENGWMEI